jgi:hypothetical protein
MIAYLLEDPGSPLSEWLSYYAPCIKGFLGILYGVYGIFKSNLKFQQIVKRPGDAISRLMKDRLWKIPPANIATPENLSMQREIRFYQCLLATMV